MTVDIHNYPLRASASWHAIGCAAPPGVLGPGRFTGLLGHFQQPRCAAARSFADQWVGSRVAALHRDPGTRWWHENHRMAGWQCLQVLKLREFWCFDANVFSCLRDGARMGVSDSACVSVSQTSPILSSNGDSLVQAAGRWNGYPVFFENAHCSFYPLVI